MPSREEILFEYLERLPYPPYPVQEEAMYAWAAADQGVLLSAPTGTGKTLVAEAAVYEGLRTGADGGARDIILGAGGTEVVSDIDVT